MLLCGQMCAHATCASGKGARTAHARLLTSESTAHAGSTAAAQANAHSSAVRQTRDIAGCFASEKSGLPGSAGTAVFIRNSWRALAPGRQGNTRRTSGLGVQPWRRMGAEAEELDHKRTEWT